MLNLEKIRRNIQDFKARQEEIEDYNKEIKENLDILARDNDEYKARHEDVLKNGSKNPIKNQRARDESVVLGLDDRGQELNEISNEVDDLENNLKSEIDNFVTKTQEEIKKEKSRIAEAFSRRLNNPETINSLRDEKRKLEEDLKSVQGLIELHESRNVKQTDSIYQNLKRRAQADQEKIDEVNKNLDPELDEQSDDRLSDLWDEFDKYEKALEKIKDNNIEDMIKILDSTFPKINQPNQSQPAQKQEHEEELDKKSEEQVIDKNAQDNTEKGQETSEPGTMHTDSYFESAKLVEENKSEQEEHDEEEHDEEEHDEEEHDEEEHDEEEHDEEEHDEEEHDEEEYDAEEHDEEEHDEEEYDEEEYDDEEYDDEEYDDEELEEEDDKKKPGFFKRLFNKTKEVIKKIVTKVKNGSKKLTTKEYKSLADKYIKDEEFREDIKWEGYRKMAQKRKEEWEAEKAKEAAEQEEPAEKPKEEGIRDRVKADPETMKKLNDVVKEHGDDDIPSYLKQTDDKENEGEVH